MATEAATRSATPNAPRATRMRGAAPALDVTSNAAGRPAASAAAGARGAPPGPTMVTRARAGTPGEEPFDPLAVAAACVATSTAEPGAASPGMVTAPLKFPLLSGLRVASTGPFNALKWMSTGFVPNSRPVTVTWLPGWACAGFEVREATGKQAHAAANGKRMAPATIPADPYHRRRRILRSPFRHALENLTRHRSRPYH